MIHISDEQLVEYRRRVEDADTEIGKGVLLGPVWMDYVAEIANPSTVLQLVDAFEAARNLNSRAATLLDRVAHTCYHVAAAIPAAQAGLTAEVNDLLSTAEAAAAMSSALTPKTQPGTGDSLHVPGCSPDH